MGWSSFTRCLFTMSDRLILRKRLGSSRGLHGGHGLPEQVGGLPDMQAHVIVRRLHPVDILHLQKHDLSSRLDGNPVGGGCRRLGANFIEEFGELGLKMVGSRFVEGLARLVHRRVKSFAVEGFEQVIDGVDLERLHGELVISGGEDDRRHGLPGQRREDSETVDLRHLDVQE